MNSSSQFFYLLLSVTGPGPGILFSDEKFKLRRTELGQAPAQQRLRPSELRRRYQTETQAELQRAGNEQIRFGDSQLFLNVFGPFNQNNFPLFSSSFGIMIKTQQVPYPRPTVIFKPHEPLKFMNRQNHVRPHLRLPWMAWEPNFWLNMIQI